ncbi:hypothetical protein [Propioniciclava sinopodophylli]|uniref:hypothetical protein n=1 Tax=Propioniciclava sinopodophylli TaxID=1837344 RepID=UPI0031E65920
MAFLPRTADRVWLHSFAAIVPPLIEAFRPQVIVAQHGADPHRSDPSPTCRCPWTPWPWPNASSSTSPTGSPSAAGSAWAAATTGMTQRACRRGGRTPRSVVTDTMTTHPVWECPIWNILASLHASWARRVTL